MAERDDLPARRPPPKRPPRDDGDESNPNDRRLQAGMTIAMLVTYAGLILFVLPAFEPHKVIPDVARWVASRAQPDDRITRLRRLRATAAQARGRLVQLLAPLLPALLAGALQHLQR